MSERPARTREPVATLPKVVSRLARDPAALPAILEQHRTGLMARVREDHGIGSHDDSARWTVQEIANLDYLFTELPATFKAVVAKGPALVRRG